MKAFIINLAESTERKAEMLRQLKRCGLEDYEFIRAVRGTALTQSELDDSFMKRKSCRHLHRDLSLNEVGCALSHQLVYERMVHDGVEKALVFEDDVRLDGNFSGVVSLLEGLSLENFVIKLDARDSIRAFNPHSIKLSEDYCVLHPLNNLRFAWGYCLDLKAAKSLRSNFYPIFTEADDWFAFRGKIKLRALNKQLVHEIGLPSDIGSRSGVERKKMPRLIRKIVRTYDDLISIMH